jgi:hypothetical protein
MSMSNDVGIGMLATRISKSVKSSRKFARSEHVMAQ